MAKSTKPIGRRIPPAVEGIQVNFCKNPECYNFGIPAEENIKGKTLPVLDKAETGSRHKDNYSIDGRGNNTPTLKCHACGQKPPIKSNKAIHEELQRMEDHLLPTEQDDPSCKTPGCPNQVVPLSEGNGCYTKHGRSKGGSQRYLCKECNVTFAVGSSSTLRQRLPELNELIFKLLVNKVPFHRICEIADINISTLFDKIDFIYGRCRVFAGNFERKIPSLQFDKLEISADVQEYGINWINSSVKKNVVVSALGSAENRSGFIFGMHVNVDSALDPVETERDAIALGDFNEQPPFRKYARLWLTPDYQASATRSTSKSSKAALTEDIQAAYYDESLREDIESYEAMNVNLNLPHRGMQVHGEYTMYGHFLFLKRLLPGAKKLRFYIEKESAMRAACLSAFVDEIKDGRCEAFYVRINKGMTIHEKDRAMVAGRRLLEDFRATDSSFAEVSDYGLRELMLGQMIKDGDFVTYGAFKDKWYSYPAPHKNEPEKAICWLTDTGDHSVPEFVLAKRFLSASLFGIDRFFMSTRRRLSLLERPIASASATGRKWYGYSPYNPSQIVKVLEILRVYHNYVYATARVPRRKLLKGETKRKPGTVAKVYETPATRLKIAIRPHTVGEIIGCM